jgi:YebC/PmpR family DNA-binding regulatory protein
MSGHSKWNNIKNRKGAVDAKRGKVFTQLAKQIKAAVQQGSSDDPKSNPHLRIVLDKAREANMPKENIKRALERGMGKTATGASIQEVVYEGFGPGGVGYMVVAQTDNHTRTSGEIRFIFSRNAGSLTGPGSAGYLFKRATTGEYEPVMPLEIQDPAVMEQVVQLFETLSENDDVEEVYCSVNLGG